MPQTQPITPRKKRQPDHDSDGSYHEDESPTKKLKTPKRKMKQENSDASQTGNAPRPVKKETRTPQQRIKPEVTNDMNENASPIKSPSKTAQKKAEAAQRKQWKEGWRSYLIENQWKKDTSYTQKAGDDIHKTEAKKFYGLNDHEMGLLPYIEFENENNPSHPGRSYSEEAVKNLAYRKLATLNGKRKDSQIDLDAGRKLFDEYREKREQKNPNSPKKPRTIEIFGQESNYSGSGGFPDVIIPMVFRSHAFQRDLDYQFDHDLDSDGSYDDPAPFT